MYVKYMQNINTYVHSKKLQNAIYLIVYRRYSNETRYVDVRYDVSHKRIDTDSSMCYFHRHTRARMHTRIYACINLHLS